MADTVQQAVITGLGAVSPHGRGVKALWSGLLEGRSAFTPLTLFDASMFRNPLAGVVTGYPPPTGTEPARALRMLDDAADEALRDALGYTPPTPPFQGGENCRTPELAARLAEDPGFTSAAIV